MVKAGEGCLNAAKIAACAAKGVAIKWARVVTTVRCTGSERALPPSECSSKAIDGTRSTRIRYEESRLTAQSGVEDGHQQLISVCGDAARVFPGGGSTSVTQSGNRVGQQAAQGRGGRAVDRCDDHARTAGGG
jgi:hypothetical protein